MTAKLYAVPASHPCAAVEVALNMKDIPFRRTDMLPLAQVLAGPILYGGVTVPGLRIDGKRMVGSRAIMRHLDEIAPQPPLLPAEPAQRERVLEAERFGDEVLQSAVRRILDVAFVRAPRAMESYAAQASLPIPPSAMRPLMPLTARLMAIRNSANEAAGRSDIMALPRHFERIEQWIDAGDLGGDPPNAADLQIGSSIRLLWTIADLRTLIEAHPRIAELTRYFPSPQPGEIPLGTLPAQWLPAA
ncbi:MAG: glutathione S-transferase N-terminal domain-containing protein [Solirubrobacteraceae bacterium]